MRTTDAIAAIATPAGESGIGIIRLSGEDAVSIADRVFSSPSGRTGILSHVLTHTIHHGYIVRDGERIDEVLALVMRGPNTYTGEDTVEFDCHGGPLILNSVLNAVLSAGARSAEPGEYTKRAFLNGKMDLARSEAVLDLIEAKNSYAIKAAMNQLGGQLSDTIHSFREIILHEIAYIEAALDDPEHYDLNGYPNVLLKKIEPVEDGIKDLIKSSETGKYLHEGIKACIIGRPNAGKSSIYNLLVGKDQAIVTDIEGTTRDTLTEHIRMAGITLEITDTAGIRQTDNPVESIGVKKAKQAARDADLIICVIDGTGGIDEEDIKLLDSIREKKGIVLLNKSDISVNIKKIEIKKFTDKPVIIFSAADSTGLKKMEELIKEMFYKGELEFNDQIFITRSRYTDSLNRALKSLNMVSSSIDSGQPEDFFSIDLTDAYEALGEITGEALGDDIVDRIFSEFCMGK